MKPRLAILIFVLVGWSAPVLAQGCAMCYSTAQANSADGQRTINKAVLVLLVPPAAFMTLGIWMAHRYAHKRDLEQHESRERSELAGTWR